MRGRTAAACALVPLLLTTGCWGGGSETAGSSTSASASSSPVASTRVQGPAPTPWVVRRAGARVVCPTGAAPAVDLRAVRVHPDLSGGTRMLPGAYRVQLGGVVVNETTSPIVVEAVVLRVGGRPWRPSVTAPDRLGPGSSGPLRVGGAYASRRAQPARFVAHLRWHWADPTLRVCGDRGLLDDD